MNGARWKEFIMVFGSDVSVHIEERRLRSLIPLVHSRQTAMFYPCGWFLIDYHDIFCDLKDHLLCCAHRESHNNVK